MEQQKVFATAWRGFDKKAVLDYIYEQDVHFKKREEQLNEQLAEYESKLDETDRSDDGEGLTNSYQQQIETLEQACNVERENAQSLQEQLDKLRRDSDQLIQAARSKDGELQLQLELNRQLQQKCEVLEEKLSTLAHRLMADREAAVHITSPSVTVVETRQQSAPAAKESVEEPATSAAPPSSFNNLKGELNDFRQSVSKTLLNFESALARLEEDKPSETLPQEDADFFP